jgi:cation diffusion facilitator family transporter
MSVSTEQTLDERYHEARRVTWAGAVVNVTLAIAKILLGWIGHSQALIADGIHSISDLVSDAMVLVAAKHASHGADAEHPYGHARFETAATVFLGVLLLTVAAGIALDAGRRLLEPAQLLAPGVLALVGVIGSIVIKEWLYHYTMRVAARTRSSMLRANAWHHRSDAISSIVVLFGIIGVMLGFPYLDAAAAITVALMIAKIGWDLGGRSLRELVDTALDPDRVTAIREAILSVNGVAALHLLRSRRMGADALVDVHILVDPTVSVSEGHHIGEAVRSRLIGEFDEISDVTVHVDPEDDERVDPSLALPLRDEVVQQLHERWSAIPIAQRIEEINLHYLDGRIQVDVVLPLSVLDERSAAKRIEELLRKPLRGMKRFGSLRLYFS